MRGKFLIIFGMMVGAGLQASSFRMAFGSCFSHKYINLDSLIFDSVAAENPDCWVWLGTIISLGDAAYTDTCNFSMRKYHFDPNLTAIQERFDEVANDHHYQLVANSTKVYGVWDDHDYGLDNGGKSMPIKDVMRKLYLDFLKEPADSPRRTRAGGIYESYFLDPEKKVKLILLDNRWSLDEEE